MHGRATEDRICIIGAGFAGLGAAKAFKDAGIDYDQIEADDGVGGNWYHGVYDSTHLISSRDSTQYADFPMPRDYPDFPSRDQMVAYLNSYTDAHGLREQIEFETTVERVEPIGQDGMDGWRVTLEGGEVREYTGVVVANGHHWATRIPDFPGDYAGKTLHSKDYKRPSDLDGERILVVGAGNSACDIAVEAAREGLESHISIRRGTHFLPKTIFGIPSSEFDRWWMPVRAQRAMLRVLLRVSVGTNESYGLPAPEHDLFDRHPTVNSQLLYDLRHGRIKPRPNVERFDGKTVHFADGTSGEFDTIVYGTGFNVSFPFLDHELFEWEGGYPKLAGIMPPGVANLYVFGLGQPRGGAGPLITAGSRLLARMILTQRDLDHPLSTILAKLRRPEARELFGVSEMLRDIKMGEQAVRAIHWIARRRGRSATPPPSVPPAAGEPQADRVSDAARVPEPVS